MTQGEEKVMEQKQKQTMMDEKVAGAVGDGGVRLPQDLPAAGPLARIEPHETTEEEVLESEPAKALALTRQALQVIKEVICRNATPAELFMFLRICKAKGLDPLMPGQIAFEAWNDKSGKRHRMIMIEIHGMRFLVQRDCGSVYRPGRVEFVRDEKERPRVCRISCWRRAADGEWYEYVEERNWDDYRTFHENRAWDRFPTDKFQIATEARLLRRVFPEVLGGVYTREEIVLDELAVVDVEKVRPSAAQATPTTTVDVKAGGTRLFNRLVAALEKTGLPKKRAAAAARGMLCEQTKTMSIHDWTEKELSTAEAFVSKLERDVEAKGSEQTTIGEEGEDAPGAGEQAKAGRDAIAAVIVEEAEAAKIDVFKLEQRFCEEVFACGSLPGVPDDAIVGAIGAPDTRKVIQRLAVEIAKEVS